MSAFNSPGVTSPVADSEVAVLVVPGKAPPITGVVYKTTSSITARVDPWGGSSTIGGPSRGPQVRSCSSTTGRNLTFGCGSDRMGENRYVGGGSEENLGDVSDRNLALPLPRGRFVLRRDQKLIVLRDGVHLHDSFLHLFGGTSSGASEEVEAECGVKGCCNFPTTNWANTSFLPSGSSGVAPGWEAGNPTNVLVEVALLFCFRLISSLWAGGLIAPKSSPINTQAEISNIVVPSKLEGFTQSLGDCGVLERSIYLLAGMKIPFLFIVADNSVSVMRLRDVHM